MQRPEPKLNHMPRLIKQKITDALPNVETKLALSQMSKEFQSLAEDSPIKYDELIFEIRADIVSVIRIAEALKCQWGYTRKDCNKHTMLFSAHKDGVLMRNPKSGWEKVLPEEDYRKAAVQYCLSIMTAKTEIGEFILKHDDTSLSNDRPPNYPNTRLKVIADEMERVHNGFKHQLIVKCITIHFQVTECQILKILNCLDVENLEEIKVIPYLPFEPEALLDLEQVTDKCKKVKKLTVYFHKCDLSLEKWTNYEKLELFVRRSPTKTEIIELFLSKPTLKELYVKRYYDFICGAGVAEYLERFEQEPLERDMCSTDHYAMVAIHLPNDPNTRVEIDHERSHIRVRRKDLIFSPTLTQMPFYIKQKITDMLPNVETKLALSQVSRQFQSLAKRSSIKYDELIIEISADKVSVIRIAEALKCQWGLTRKDCNNHIMNFSTHKDGVLMRNPKSGWEKVLWEKDYRKAAVQYCLGIMNAKTEIGEFILKEDFSNSRECAKRNRDRRVIIYEMEQVHNEFEYQLIVKSISIQFQVTEIQLLKILNCLDVEILEEIKIVPYTPYERDLILNLDQVTEKCKKVKKLTVYLHKCDLSLEKWTNYEILRLFVRRPPTKQAIIEMFVGKPTFKELSVFCYDGLYRKDVTEFLEKFEQEPNEGTREVVSSDSYGHVTIRLPNEPHTKIEINHDWRDVSVRRKPLVPS